MHTADLRDRNKREANKDMNKIKEEKKTEKKILQSQYMRCAGEALNM